MPKWTSLAFLLASAIFTSGAASAQANPLAPTIVIEYYNEVLDHYFLSTPPEAALIDAGSAGSGWRPTGETFRGEPIAYHPFGQRICRFYGSVAPGPNSHFFTVDAAECILLRQLEAQAPASVPRWNFEGLAFPVGVPVGGSCTSPYSKPVLRLYNDGFRRGVDSNHRYATRTEVVNQMIGQGWTLEGLAFCALP